MLLALGFNVGPLPFDLCFEGRSSWIEPLVLCLWPLTCGNRALLAFRSIYLYHGDNSYVDVFCIPVISFIVHTAHRFPASPGLSGWMADRPLPRHSLGRHSVLLPSDGRASDLCYWCQPQELPHGVRWSPHLWVRWSLFKSLLLRRGQEIAAR